MKVVTTRSARVEGRAISPRMTRIGRTTYQYVAPPITVTSKVETHKVSTFRPKLGVIQFSAKDIETGCESHLVAMTASSIPSTPQQTENEAIATLCNKHVNSEPQRAIGIRTGEFQNQTVSLCEGVLQQGVSEGTRPSERYHLLASLF